MPLIRYQIRNEHSLADHELYRNADKDDPEALLEGVAMAGLVGVLRQLGDLAEFAAEIFHDLHEEVMATTARGHFLMVRVQQLEAEFPSIEKAFLSQTDHSIFYHKKGVDWHPNLHTVQNLVAGGDLPRFVMDSYEECRGPPRLFLLDKFDVAGAGACLKRYTDPSFFKVETTSSVVKKAEVQKDKKNRKVKKKGSRWRNGGTPEVAPASHAKLHQLLLEERVQNCNSDPAHHVTLKRRLLNGCLFDSKTGKSYMEKILDSNLSEHSALPLALTDNNTCDSIQEIVEISMLSPTKEQLQRNITTLSSPHIQETDLKLTIEDISEVVTEEEILRVPKARSDGEADEILFTSREMVDKDFTVVGDSKNDGSIDDYHSDEVGSEVCIYVDALPMMESEMDSDPECRYKSNLCFSSVEKNVADSDANESYNLRPQFSDFQSIGNSNTSEEGNNSLKTGRHSCSYSDTLSNLAENILSDGDGAAKVFHCIDCVPEIVCTSSNQLPVNEMISGTESHELVEFNSTSIEEVAEIPSYRSYQGEASCRSWDTDSNPMLLYLKTEETLVEVSSNYTIHRTGLSNTDEQGGSLGDNLNITSPISVVSSETSEIPIARVPAEINPMDELVDSDNSSAVSDVLLHKSNVNDAICPSSDLIYSPSWNSRDSHDTVSISGKSPNNDLEINEAICPITLAETEKQKEVKQLGAAPADLSFMLCNAIPDDADTANLSLAEEMRGPSSKHVDHDLDTSPESKSALVENMELEINEANCPISLAETEKQEEVKQLGTAPEDLSFMLCNATPDDGDMANLSLAEEMQGSSSKHVDHDLDRYPQSKSHLVENIEYSMSLRDDQSPEPIIPLEQNPKVQVDQSDVNCLHGDEPKIIPLEQNPKVQVDQSDVDCLHGDEPKIMPLNDQSIHTHPLYHIDQERCSNVPSESRREEVPSQSSAPQFLQQSAGQELGSSEESTNLLETIFPSFVQLPRTSHASMEETPPLPPLPPMQWRLGKLLQIPKLSEEETINYGLDSNQQLLSSQMADGNAHFGFPAVEGRTTELQNPYLPLSAVQEEEKPEHVFRDSVESLVQPSLPELQMPIMVSNGTKHSFHNLKESPPLNPLISLPPMSNELHQNGIPDSEGEMFRNLNPLSAAQSIERTAEHCPILLNGELVQHLNQVEAETSLEDKKHQQAFRCSEGNMVNPPGTSVPLPPTKAEQPKDSHHGLQMVDVETAPLSSASSLPTTVAGQPNESHHGLQMVDVDIALSSSASSLPLVSEDEKPNGKPLMKIPRPPDPLIEAVAAHDKRKLKKVIERVMPQIKPKVDNRDSLLEQIRTKSFNLKPAAMARPSIQGPTTNLKVAAILEKANAIRQALAGSDEDDDADSWSDS